MILISVRTFVSVVAIQETLIYRRILNIFLIRQNCRNVVERFESRTCVQLSELPLNQVPPKSNSAFTDTMIQRCNVKNTNVLIGLVSPWLVILDCCTILFCCDASRWFREHLVDLISLESEGTNMYRKHEGAIDTYTSAAKPFVSISMLNFLINLINRSTSKIFRRTAVSVNLKKWHIFITCIEVEFRVNDFKIRLQYRIEITRWTRTYSIISLAEERTRSNAANTNKARSRGTTVDKEYPLFSQTVLTMFQQKAPALVIKYWYCRARRGD